MEKRKPLCPSDSRIKLLETIFLRDSLVTQEQAENILSQIDEKTNWQSLCTELGNVLQIGLERNSGTQNQAVPTSEKVTKPHTDFIPPKSAKRITKAPFLG